MLVPVQQTRVSKGGRAVIIKLKFHNVIMQLTMTTAFHLEAYTTTQSGGSLRALSSLLLTVRGEWEEFGTGLHILRCTGEEAFTCIRLLIHLNDAPR